MALLSEYAARGSEEAFATLVTRHVNKVYSVALRHTRNPHQAEEITQAVFVILARKARHLGKGVILEGWLYQTARLTALTSVRGESRRVRREQEACMRTLLNEDESKIWEQITPLLDTALGSLNEADRHAVVLRFIYDRSMKEVGTALGASESAATVRLHRALEKLRKFLARHGVSSTGAIIAGAISANSVQAAPPVLAKTVTAVAVAKGATASGSTLTLIKGAMKLMAWTKVKTAIVVGTTVILAAGTTTTLVSQYQPRAQNGEVRVALADQTNGLMVGIASSFVVVPDESLKKLGITWQSAESGGRMGLLDKSETKIVMQTLHAASGVEFLASPRSATQNGMGVELSVTKPVKVADTNADIGIILQATALYSSDYSSLELSVTNELHELVDVTAQPNVQITKVAASPTLKPGQTLVMRQTIAEGNLLDKNIGKSSNLLVFVTPTTFKAGTGLHKLK